MNKKKPKTDQISFRCSSSLKRAIEIISALEGSTPSNYIEFDLQISVTRYLAKNPKVLELMKDREVLVDDFLLPFGNES